MTQPMTVEQILKELIPAAPFLTGITVSGGESTMHLKFVLALLSAIKQHPQLLHLTCLIDSNGYLSKASWGQALPLIDGAMIDLKAHNDILHKNLTGRSNYRVLESIRFLHQHNKLTEVRLIAIPGKTDTDKEIKSIADFLSSVGKHIPVRINAFSNEAVRGEARDWPCFPEDQLATLKQRFEAIIP